MRNKNLYYLEQHKETIDKAVLWLAKFDHDISDEEMQEFEKWLDEKREHRRAFIEVANIWEKMDCLSRLAEIFPETLSKRGIARHVALTVITIVFAAIMLVMNAGTDDTSILNNAGRAAPVSNEERVYRTAVGEHSTVSLSDGSELVLNTNSHVRVRFTDEKRDVILVRGELYVNVAHDERRPLSVHAGSQTVTAIGTEFNLMITEQNQIDLVVTEGKVVVGMSEQEQGISVPTTRGSVNSRYSPKEVSSGQQLILGNSHWETKVLQPEEIEVKLSWRNGSLVFVGESLEDALLEIERYTQVEFVIVGEELKKVRVVGRFKAGDVDGLLNTLQENFDITYQRININKVILASK